MMMTVDPIVNAVVTMNTTQTKTTALAIAVAMVTMTNILDV